MKKKINLLVIASFITLNVIAQNAKVVGKIKTKSNTDYLEFVKVSIDEKYFTTTDANGFYSISGIDSGIHNIKVSVLGFESFDKEFKILSNQEIFEMPDIILKENSIRINEVTIYGNPQIFSNNYEGSNITVSPKSIKNIRPLGTEEILKTVPGINVSGDMGISNRLNVGIRGSYPRRSVNILLLEDGTPIAPAPYLAPEAYYNPPGERIDAIEVIKGSDVIAFGTNTMYGAINYITKKPPLIPTLSLNLSSGTNNFNSAFATYGGTWNNIGAELQILKKEFGGFQLNSNSDIFNITAKIYAELNKKSSFYLKLNYNNENSKATYSALTPLTFNVDAKQNPFDADDLSTTRYGVDFIYKRMTNCSFLLTSKVYASQFQRDWWRQENTLIKASVVKSYVGENIYSQKYSYLENHNFTTDDYVRVGKIAAGKEQTRARNRMFKVFGVQQSVKKDYKIFKVKSSAELIYRSHFEFFDNIEIKNDSSRFSRSGILDKDNYYELSAHSVYFKNKFEYLFFSITPHLRAENVTMYSFDRLAISKNPKNDGSRYFGSMKNTFNSFTPGISLNYNFLKNHSNNINLLAGIYKGYNAPVAEVGFMKVEDFQVSKAATNDEINRKPETSLNFESGLRGAVLNNLFTLQAIYFKNTISNFYSAGRNEAFQTLGKVTISGFETSLGINLNKFLNLRKHELYINFSGTFMNGKILEGILSDADILKAKHNAATKNEIIEKVNLDRSGFNVYMKSTKNTDSLINRNIDITDFDKIVKLDYVFGKDKLENNQLPYVPNTILSTTLNYKYNNFSMLVIYNYVSAQYTDFINLENETSEGALGKLKAFSNIDLNLSYSFKNSKNKILKGTTIFWDCKNITNQIYASSRLHRVSSGIMPGGFRQINIGVKININ